MGYRIWGRRPWRSGALLSTSHEDRVSYQHDSPLLRLALTSWFKSCLSGVFSVKFLLFFPGVVFFKVASVCTPHGPRCVYLGSLLSLFGNCVFLSAGHSNLSAWDEASLHNAKGWVNDPRFPGDNDLAMLGPHHLLDRFFRPVLSKLITAGRLQYLNLIKIKRNLQFSSSNAPTCFKGSVATADEWLACCTAQVMGHFHPQFHDGPLPPYPSPPHPHFPRHPGDNQCDQHDSPQACRYYIDWYFRHFWLLFFVTKKKKKVVTHRTYVFFPFLTMHCGHLCGSIDLDLIYSL